MIILEKKRNKSYNYYFIFYTFALLFSRIVKANEYSIYRKSFMEEKCNFKLL